MKEMMEMSGNLDNLFLGVDKDNTMTHVMPLLDKGGVGINSFQRENNKKTNKPTQVQLQAMQRWKKMDDLLQGTLCGVSDMSVLWKEQVKQTGLIVDECGRKIDDVTSQVDKMNDNFVSSNKKLKVIIDRYNKPHKFCIDIVLVLLLLGMIVGMVEMNKK